MHSSISPITMDRAGYYLWQCVCCVLWWLLLYGMTRRPLFALGAARGSLLTRPSWLPPRALLRLHTRRARAVIYSAVPISLALGAFLGHSSTALRCVIAIVISVYHLTETSSTNRHGEYPLLYNAWACLLPEDYAHAVSLGIAVHFILSSGAAKLLVAGAAWPCSPTTMRTYLSIYRDSTSMPPLSRELNRWAASRDWATVAISALTIAVECVVVPATLLMPPAWRPLGCHSMVALHIGIATALSFKVGLAFFTVLPSYIYGFSCAAAVGSMPHLSAVCVGLLPTLWCLLRRRLLPEDWPSCPIALFMWSGDHAAAMAAALMTGDTRVVLCTAAVAQRGVVGLPVVHHGATGARGSDVVHDAVLRVIGFTLLQGNWPPACVADSGEWDTPLFVRGLEGWLQRDCRMIEASSGEAAARAFLVQIDEEGVVQRVLG